MMHCQRKARFGRLHENSRSHESVIDTGINAYEPLKFGRRRRRRRQLMLRGSLAVIAFSETNRTVSRLTE